MTKSFFSAICLLLLLSNCTGQVNNSLTSAQKFLKLLDAGQKQRAIFPLTSDERFIWNYVPLNNRNGISLKELNSTQKEAALELMKTSLSEKGYDKASAIMALENVLKQVEGLSSEDDYRDPGKYFFTIFGQPSDNGAWGWRVDGHHLSLSFSSIADTIISGTPSFFGANPAVVLDGPKKGLQLLREEEAAGFQLLNSLREDQMEKAIISTRAPGDIITGNRRLVTLTNETGIGYNDLDNRQQKLLLDLVEVYIHRYTKTFANSMMEELKQGGWENIRFTWAGSKDSGPGNKTYYRIMGPTILIEFDNTQNNGNHVHTVIRDLKRDFGGDLLLQHYNKQHP